jgi:hypothetical protein
VLRHLTGSTGGIKITRVARLFLIADKRAARAHLERLAALPGLCRIIVPHHVVIDRTSGMEPGAALAAAAATL